MSPSRAAYLIWKSWPRNPSVTELGGLPHPEELAEEPERHRAGGPTSSGRAGRGTLASLSWAAYLIWKSLPKNPSVTELGGLPHLEELAEEL